MDTLSYIQNKFNLDFNQKMPIEIPNFGRNQLAQLFNELDFKKGAEIGVEQGVYSEILCKANPNLMLLCVDAWEPHKGYRDHTSKTKLDRFYEITKKRLMPYKNVLIEKGYSMDVVRMVKDETLDFVYIDADHSFVTTTNDIYEWSKKVRKGGIIAGHDYIEYGHVHVKQVLRGYTDAYKISPWFVLGRQAKIEGEIRDDSRSWMFIKQ